MQSLKNILEKYEKNEDKYISREFQTFGLYLAEELQDMAHKSLYIKLAKTTPRLWLQQALTFACDSTAKKKGALFMWKLKQIKEEKKKQEEVSPK